MSVEVGAVDAREAHLSADRDAAGAAHSRSVYHDRIHADDGFYTVFLSQRADELHHYRRADGDYKVVLYAALDPRAQPVRDKPLAAVRAVVGQYRHARRRGAHLVLEYNEVLRPEARDDVDLRAAVVQILSLRIRDRAAQTSADDRNALRAAAPVFYKVRVELGRVAERADEIQHALAHVQRRQSRGGFAHCLKDYHDAAVIGGSGDGQRHTFTFLVRSEYYELPRFCLFCNSRRVNTHQHRRIVQTAFFEYGKHVLLLASMLHDDTLMNDYIMNPA